ncbi:MAG: hypothetical protein M1524_02380, partial [Patescibacteria group bacterium]|nr:hypothetical protein [Patescibacteria group bacterium]
MAKYFDPNGTPVEGEALCCPFYDTVARDNGTIAIVYKVMHFDPKADQPCQKREDSMPGKSELEKTVFGPPPLIDKSLCEIQRAFDECPRQKSGPN